MSEERDEHSRVHELEADAHRHECAEAHERLEIRIGELEAQIADLRGHEHDHEGLEVEAL